MRGTWQIDPRTVRPTAGHLLVELTERMGGTTPTGLVVPVQADDRPGKDTAYGVLIAIGPQPFLKHKSHRTADGRGYMEAVPGPVRWPEGWPGFHAGDILVFPRDVPMAFMWGERRYALIEMSDVIFAVDEADPARSLREQGLEIKPSF